MDTVIAGSCAALAVDILIYPLDTVKTRLQAQAAGSSGSSGSSSRGGSGGGGLSKVPLRGLYQGVGSVVLVTLPAAAIFFTTYEGVKGALLPGVSAHGSGHSSSGTGSDESAHGSEGTAAGYSAARIAASHACASASAELVSCAVLTPAEVIKQRAQVLRSSASATSSSSSSSASLQAFRETFSPSSSSGRGPPSSALRVLTRGYLALAARNLPYTALQFPLYEHVRARLARSLGVERHRPRADGGYVDEAAAESGAGWNSARAHRRSEEAPRLTRSQELLRSGAASAGAGALAGGFAAAATTPIDVAKTRIMLGRAGGEAGGTGIGTGTGGGSGQVAKSFGGGGAAGAPGVLDTLRGIYAAEGVRGLMRGGALRSAWTALGAAVYLSAYETGRVYVRERYM